MKLVSLRELSRILGVTKRAVEQAIEYGRITPEKKERHGKSWRYFFNSDKAAKDWVDNTDQSMKFGPTRREMGKGPQPLRNGEGTKGEKRESKEQKPTTFNEIRTEREKINLEIEKITLQKLEGSVVETDAVKSLFFEMSSRVSQSIMTVADRIAPIVATQTDPKKIKDLLKKELSDALSSFADGEISFANLHQK